MGWHGGGRMRLEHDAVVMTNRDRGDRGWDTWPRVWPVREYADGGGIPEGGGTGCPTFRVTYGRCPRSRAEPGLAVKDKKAHYIAVAKRNQPALHAQISALPWRRIPAGVSARETGHGRAQTRTLKAAHVSRLDFPHARRAIKSSAGGRTPPPAGPPARPSAPSPA
jgi:hypothetical protein